MADQAKGSPSKIAQWAKRRPPPAAKTCSVVIAGLRSLRHNYKVGDERHPVGRTAVIWHPKRSRRILLFYQKLAETAEQQIQPSDAVPNEEWTQTRLASYTGQRCDHNAPRPTVENEQRRARVFTSVPAATR